MSPENRKTSNPHELLLNLPDKINLKRSDENIALSNLRICYTWKNMKLYRNNNLKYHLESGMINL